MRLDNASRNIKYATISFAVVNLLKFVVRFVFVRTLPVEFLGINGLFSNIISVLSLAELGIGPAIVYSLYKPLAVGDIETVKSLMQLFKKAYVRIGCFIIVVGLAISPWLEWFIKDKPSIDGLKIFYAIFILNTGLSYFFSYKRNLLIADQKQYIDNLYQSLVQIALALGQIIALLVYPSFLVYIILMLLATLVENYWLSTKTEHIYPYIKEKNALPLAPGIKQTIKHNVEAMIAHKVGSIVVFGSSNLILSKFVGLTAVGLYSNYYMVINALNNFAGKFFGSITASIGNLIALDTNEKKIKIFRVTEFLTAWQAANIFVGFVVMFNPLIELWLGPEYLFEQQLVILLSINFYFTYMRKAVQTFKDASGLYWQDRYKPFVESIVNFAASIYLVKSYGVAGVILGGIISTLGVCFWWEAYVLFKWGLERPLIEYFGLVSKYVLVTIGIALLTYNVYTLFVSNISITSFILGCFLCIIVTNLVWFIIFRRTGEFLYVNNVIRTKVKDYRK
jgi:O-antigen/teichoic acid export membrane protein